VGEEIMAGKWPEYLKDNVVYDLVSGKYLFRGKSYRRRGQAVKAAFIYWSARND
jgi:hypothetical protein